MIAISTKARETIFLVFIYRVRVKGINITNWK